MRKQSFKQWLLDHNISQRECSEALGIGTPSLNKKLNGHTSWLDSDLRRINEVYGLSADFVLGLKKPRHEVTARGRGMDHQENTRKSFGETRPDSISPVLAAFVKGGME